MATNVKKFAMLAMAALVTAIMFPLAMQQIVGTPTTVVGNATGIWNSAFVVLWQVLLPVMVVISIAILFLPGQSGE
jgi:hypothetical protein